MFSHGNISTAHGRTEWENSNVHINPLSPPPPPPHQILTTAPNGEEFEGPTSPDAAVAYHDQLRRASVNTSLTGRARSNTATSAASSFRSAESANTSLETTDIARRLSGRSSVSRMTGRSERPESNLFNKSIFARSSRRKHESMSIAPNQSVGMPVAGSARDRYTGRSQSDAGRKLTISGPYNFQHLTHHAKNVPLPKHTSREELISEFATLRTSQVPTRGQLKGIKAEELSHAYSHSMNSSSIHESEWRRPSTGYTKPRSQRNVLQKNSTKSRHSVRNSKSHDNLQRTPPRPARSPEPVDEPRLDLAGRGLSHDDFLAAVDPFAQADRPKTSGCVRQSFQSQLPTPPPPTMWQEKDYFSPHDMPHDAPHAVSTPDEVAWPLPAFIALPQDNLRSELTEVPEDRAPQPTSINRRMSATRKPGVRVSQSFSQLRPIREPQAEPFAGFQEIYYQGRRDTQSSVTLVQPEPMHAVIETPDEASTDRKDSEAWSSAIRDSWEDDIDYCYEHEAEADCDYDWDRDSLKSPGDAASLKDVGIDECFSTDPSHLDEDDDSYVPHDRRFRPSLIVPSPFDIPELSPLSQNSNSSIKSPMPHTPLQGSSLRHSQLLKDSKNSAPTLLIPGDYTPEISQEAIYDELLANGHSGEDQKHFVFRNESEETISPVDHRSSITSYRSSRFSRSSSTNASNYNSQESILLSRAASVVVGHRSASSGGSLPDLIASRRRSRTREEDELTNRLQALSIAQQQSTTTSNANGLAVPWKEEPALSPVAESFVDPHFMAERAAERYDEDLTSEPTSPMSPFVAPPKARDSLYTQKNPSLTRFSPNHTDASVDREKHGRKGSMPLLSYHRGSVFVQQPLRKRSESSALRASRRGSYFVGPPTTIHDYPMGTNVI